MSIFVQCALRISRLLFAIKEGYLARRNAICCVTTRFMGQQRSIFDEASLLVNVKAWILYFIGESDKLQQTAHGMSLIKKKALNTESRKMNANATAVKMMSGSKCQS